MATMLTSQVNHLTAPTPFPQTVPLRGQKRKGLFYDAAPAKRVQAPAGSTPLDWRLFPQTISWPSDHLVDYTEDDRADFPSVADTAKHLEAAIQQHNPKKYGSNMAKVAMNSAYIQKIMAFKKDEKGSAGSAQDKDSWSKDYVMADDALFKHTKKGAKKNGEGENRDQLEFIAPREYYHDLLVRCHKAAGHKGRDPTADMLRVSKIHGPTKDFINTWINESCPTCRVKPGRAKLRQPRGKKAGTAARQSTASVASSTSTSTSSVEPFSVPSLTQTSQSPTEYHLFTPSEASPRADFGADLALLFDYLSQTSQEHAPAYQQHGQVSQQYQPMSVHPDHMAAQKYSAMPSIGPQQDSTFAYPSPLTIGEYKTGSEQAPCGPLLANYNPWSDPNLQSPEFKAMMEAMMEELHGPKSTAPIAHHNHDPLNAIQQPASVIDPALLSHETMVGPQESHASNGRARDLIDEMANWYDPTPDANNDTQQPSLFTDPATASHQTVDELEQESHASGGARPSLTPEEIADLWNDTDFETNDAMEEPAPVTSAVAALHETVGGEQQEQHVSIGEGLADQELPDLSHFDITEFDAWWDPDSMS